MIHNIKLFKRFIFETILDTRLLLKAFLFFQWKFIDSYLPGTLLDENSTYSTQYPCLCGAYICHTVMKTINNVLSDADKY